MDERLVAYVDAQWTELVDFAKDLCVDSAEVGDEEAAQDAVLAALTTIAARWWLVSDRDHLGPEVRRRVERACKRRDRERSEFRPVEIGYVDAAPDGTTEEVSREGAGAGASTRYTPADALAVLRRRTRRIHHARLAVVGISVVVLLGAVVLRLAGTGDTPARHPTALRSRAVPSVALPQRPSDFASGVSAGDGAIWTIESGGSAHGPRSFVMERDPVSGQIKARYVVPQPDDHIAFGLGEVWAWHDNTDFSTTAIATVDGAGQVDTLHTRPPVAIKDVTFTRDGAWLTEPAADSVVLFRRGVLGAAHAWRSVGARYVVPASGHSVLVAGRSGALRELPDDRLVDHTEARPSVLFPAPGYGFWVGHGRRVAYQGSAHAAPTVSLSLPLRVGAVVGDPARGVYVATRSENPRHYDPYLVYYSPAALRAPNPRPTARLDGLLQAEGMVASPAGGVVFVTNEGILDAWDPAPDKP